MPAPAPTISPSRRRPTRGIGWAIRTRGDVASITPAVQRALAEIDPELRLTDVFTMSARVEKSLNPRRGADAAVARIRRGRAAAGRGRPLWRAGVSRGPAHARDRHPHGARQRASGILRLVLGEAACWSRWASPAASPARSPCEARLPRNSTAWRRARSGRDARRRASILAATSFLACLGPARRAARVSPTGRAVAPLAERARERAVRTASLHWTPTARNLARRWCARTRDTVGAASCDDAADQLTESGTETGRLPSSLLHHRDLTALRRGLYSSQSGGGTNASRCEGGVMSANAVVRLTMRALGAIALLLVVLVGPARAQAGASTGLMGRVTDSSGAGVPGVAVTLTNRRNRQRAHGHD